MRQPSEFNATVVGSGPNGLAAAILLAQGGINVTVLEKADVIGGGVRTGELTIPGFRHDIGAAIMPMAAASPFLESLPLAKFGLKWIDPPAAMAHPFDDGHAVLLTKSIQETGETLEKDAVSYDGLVRPLVGNWQHLRHELLGTMRFPLHPAADARLALKALRSAKSLAECYFKGQRAKGFFAGLSAHSVLPLNRVPSAAIGLVMCVTGHTAGWPIPSGGAGSISGAMAQYLISLGGKVVTGQNIEVLSDLPPAKAVFYDTSPRQVLSIYGDHLPGGYRKALRNYRYGPGIFKMDWALSGPVPWKGEKCRRAGTVHLGGTFEEIAASEMAAWQGKISDRPFVILAQPSLFDPSRAPAGKHTAWAYCHVPNGCDYDMTQYIESQVERFAPGFKDTILSRSSFSPARLEAENPNLVGGDIVGGAQTLRQLFCRPACLIAPYSVPIKGVYLCSASTPPGAGVHGMCGFHAARAFLEKR